VYAVADGTLTKQYLDGVLSSQSGNGWKLSLADRSFFFYAYLSGFADGLVVGAKVKRGALLGFVGDTGNPRTRQLPPPLRVPPARRYCGRHAPDARDPLHLQGLLTRRPRRVCHSAPVATEDDVRRIALSLPATIEKPSYGMAGFRVGDTLFARIRERADGVLVVWVESEPEKEAMIAGEPDAFFTLPHYDGYPIVLVRLAAVDEEELRELLTESWLTRAPKQVRRLLDGPS